MKLLHVDSSVLNDKSVSRELSRAVVGTGFGYDRGKRERQAQVVAALLPKVADIRRLGSAALDLCAVACGRLDAYFESGLNPWDFGAGALIAEEAGCVTSGLRGAPAGDGTEPVAGPAGVPCDMEISPSRRR